MYASAGAFVESADAFVDSADAFVDSANADRVLAGLGDSDCFPGELELRDLPETGAWMQERVCT